MSANSPFWPSQGGGNFGSIMIPNSGLDTTGAAYHPLVGDFTGDGADDVMWYRKGSASDRLWVSNGYVPHGSSIHKSVQGDYKPFIGDFDGDGAKDIFWYSPDGSNDVIWFFDSDGDHDTVLVTNVTGDYSPFVGDFDADGDDDIVWYRPETTASPVWESEGDGTFTHLWLSTPRSHFPVGYGPAN